LNLTYPYNYSSAEQENVPIFFFSRPGRPPKRALGVGMQESSRLLHHGVHGLLSPSLLAPTGLTAAAMAEAMKLQKMKLMAMNLQGGASQNGTESETEDLNSNTGGSESSWDKEKLQSPSSGPVQHGVAPSGRHGMSSSQISSLQQNHLLANRLELPFMMMPHPLLPVSLPPASVAMAMNQMNHLNTIANMAAAAQIHSPVSRATGSVIKERVQDSPSPVPSIDGAPALSSQLSSQASSSASNSPTSHPPLSPHHLVEEMKPEFEKISLAAQTLPPGFPAPFLFADGISSVETLLTNIQGLLKVAVENARVQEKQIQQEKKELKMELYKEREMRESLERQLSSELHSRATIQKRLKKEKKAKRKLQEALEFESKRREQVEQALQQATSPDTLHINGETHKYNSNEQHQLCNT
uniref:Dachshund family transcription factor 2 n=1 Tax=Denticeps clupeoides TaxID=299321 RepID=A0AAY4D0N2_9TELE